MPPSRAPINVNAASKSKAGQTSNRPKSASATPKATPKSTPRSGTSSKKSSRADGGSGNGKTSKGDAGKSDAKAKKEKAADLLTAEVITELAAKQLTMAESQETLKGTFGNLHSELGNTLGSMVDVDGMKLKDIFMKLDKNSDVRSIPLGRHSAGLGAVV